MSTRKLREKLRPLSPILQSNGNKKTAESSHPAQTESSAQDIHKKANKIQSKTKNPFHEKEKIAMVIPEACPKNINEYRHLFDDNCRFVNADLVWTLDLREYEGKRAQTSKGNKKLIKPPNFYDADLEKYKKKRKDKGFMTHGNWKNFEHLTTSRMGETVSQTQFQFGATLRNLRPMEGVFTNPHPWKEQPYKDKNDQVSFLPPFTEKEKNAIQKIDKFIIRPFKTEYEKVLVGKDYVRRKKLVPNKCITLGEYGEHMSLKPYSTNYQDKNIVNGKELYSKHTNSLCLFELGLRLYGKEEEKKVIEKKRYKSRRNENNNNDINEAMKEDIKDKKQKQQYDNNNQ